MTRVDRFLSRCPEVEASLILSLVGWSLSAVFLDPEQETEYYGHVGG